MKTDTQFVATLRQALNEDLNTRDISSTFIAPSVQAKADAIFKQRGVLCGIVVAEQIFRLVDKDLRFLPAAKDGELIEDGREIFFVQGRSRSILAAERTALNFLAHMSGIATFTRQFVDAVKGTPARVYDTRKTTPLLRRFDKYAVRTGGGINHRFGLSDGVLIKDNHFLAMPRMTLRSILENVKSNVSKKTVIGIEVQSMNQFKASLPLGADYILLDHFELEDVREAVKLRNHQGGKPQIEVSGNIRLDNITQFAQCQVDRISVGAITHSAPSVDISLNFIPSA